MNGQWDSIRKEDIRELLDGRQAEKIYPVTRRNAVLIPLLEKEGEWHILFEVRQAGIRQGGEICFPGGRVEAGESGAEAAARETAEELRIPREDIEVLAPMHEMMGPGGAAVESCLGVLSHYEGTFSKEEVDHVFTLPLSWFAAHPPAIHRADYVIETGEDFPTDLIPGNGHYPFRKIPRNYYFYETGYGVIWGMTAELLYHFLRCLQEL